MQSINNKKKAGYISIEVLLGQGTKAHIGLNKTLQVQKKLSIVSLLTFEITICQNSISLGWELKNGDAWRGREEENIFTLATGSQVLKNGTQVI